MSAAELADWIWDTFRLGTQRSLKERVFKGVLAAMVKKYADRQVQLAMEQLQRRNAYVEEYQGEVRRIKHALNLGDDRQ